MKKNTIIKSLLLGTLLFTSSQAKNVNFIEIGAGAKKTTDNTTQEQQEALALGHYCNANNIKMKDLDQFISLLHFCKMRNLDLYELKEFVSQNHITNNY